MRTPAVVLRILCLSLFLTPVATISEFSPQSAAGRGILIRGFIVTTVGGKNEAAKNSPSEDIYLPNVKVVLRDLSSNVESEPVITDLSGRFTARVAHPGKF